jgi:hypothetical protein
MDMPLPRPAFLPVMTLLLAAAAATTQPAAAADDDWAPTKDQSRIAELAPIGRPADIYHHGVRKEWGYAAPQQDTFIVVHPTTEREHAPLYVVLHSAGHDVWSCVKCTSQVGNHDIYRSPDDFYAVYLDCSANRGDWWWGGFPAGDANLARKNAGGEPRPVERRVIDCVRWVMAAYKIDPERVYLSGNSMGGSGTLGIGIRNGDLFAAIKANVPAGIEHAANRMYFPPMTPPKGFPPADPPVVVDYSAQNDNWSSGHERFVAAMNERRYALYFYWGPYGHANNSASIKTINDLIDSFDWLALKKSDPYAAFTNASCNSPLPWPDHKDDKAPGQVNAFFRWRNISIAKERIAMSLMLVTPSEMVTTKFTIPAEAKADVSLRRIQAMQVRPNEALHWSFGTASGTVTADGGGLITIPGLTITSTPVELTVGKEGGK